MMSTKLPRSQTVNEGIKEAASPPHAGSTDGSTGNNKGSGSKSLLWGWLGFGSTERPSSSSPGSGVSGSSSRSKQLTAPSPNASGGSASLRRWASLVAESPPGAEDFVRPSTGEPSKASDAPSPSSSAAADSERMSKRSSEVQPKGSIRYEVSDGDTLQSIAVKLNVTVGEITKLNRFTTRILFPGQVVNVPDPNYVPEPPVAPESIAASQQSCLDADEKVGGGRLSDQSAEQMINEDYECVEKFVKARALYLPSKAIEDAVPGMLLVTPNAVMFDPNSVAAAVDQISRDSKSVDGEGEPPASPTLVAATKSASPPLPPGDLLLPMSWIASVSIFRQIPGSASSSMAAQSLSGRQRIGSTPAPVRQGKTASVASIGEEIESGDISAVDIASASLLSSTPPNAATIALTGGADNAFDQSSSQLRSTPSASSSSSAAGAALSSTANKAVAAVSESASAITEMSSQLAGAIGTPLKRISLGTLARVEPAISQSVEKLTDVVPLTMPTRRLTSHLKRALSLQQSGDVHLSDPAAPTSLFLRITGTSWVTEDSLLSLGINNVSTASLTSAVPAHPEYWFRVPAKCARGLQLFFTHWSPEMAGLHVAGQPGAASAGNTASQVTNSAGKQRIIGFRPPDNIIRSPDGILESSYKEWEVLSIDESIKRNQAEDAEIRRNLPLPEMLGKSTVLSDDYVRELCTILPPICIGTTWTLLYSSANDGFSLSSLFRAALSSESPQLLVVHDLSGSVFGAISSCQLRVSDHFYGSSECCLFTFFPTFRVFRWSGENTFFIKGNRESLSFGSANGVIGLWLDSDLYRGRTQRCATFNNELLTTTEDFTIEVVELWGFPSS